MARITNERTPQEQQFYESVIVRLMAGESPIKLSRTLGMKIQTLRSWKYRESRRREQRGLEPCAPALLQCVATVANEEIATRRNQTEVINCGSQQSFMVEQVESANNWLRSMRGHEISRVLGSIHENIFETLEQLKTTTKQGTKLLHASYKGDITTEEVAMSLSDYASGAAAIKSILEAFAKLHCLPLMTQDVQAFKEKRHATFSPHLHLHSHGGRTKDPIKPVLATAIDITQREPTTIEPEQDEILSQFESDDLA